MAKVLNLQKFSLSTSKFVVKQQFICGVQKGVVLNLFDVQVRLVYSLKCLLLSPQYLSRAAQMPPSHCTDSSLC